MHCEASLSRGHVRSTSDSCVSILPLLVLHSCLHPPVTGRLSAAKVLYTDVNSKKIIPTLAEANGFTDMMELEENMIGVYDSAETQLAAAVYVQMENLIEAMIALEEWRDVMSTHPE
jgi:hypothetical protein